MSGIITVYEQNSRSTQTSPILFAPYRQKSPAPLLSRSTQTSQLDYVAHNTLLYSEKDILETPIRHTGHSWSRSYHTRTLSRTRRRSHSVDSDIISTHGLHSRSSAYSRDRGSIRDRSFSLIKQRRRDSSLSLDSRRNTRHRSFSSESRRRRRRRRDRSSSLERRRRRRDRSISLDSHRRKGRDRSISVDIKRRRGRSPSVSYRGRDRSFSVDNRRRGDRSLSVDYRRRDRFASLKRNRRRDRSSSLDIRRRRGRTSSTDSRKSLGRRKQRNRYESLSSQPSWRDSRINRHRERSTSIAAHKDQKRKDDLLLKYDISRDERRRDTKRDRSHSVRKNKLSPIRRDDVNDNRKEQEEYPQQRRHSHHTEVTENNMNTPKRDSSIASTRHQIEADGLSIPEYDDSSKTADLHTNEDIPLQRKRKRSSSISRNEQTFNTVAQAKSTESNKKSCRERRKERQLKRRQRELKEKQLDDDMKITQLANIINNSNTSTQSTNEGSSALSSEDTIAIEVVDAELNDIHNTSEISKGKTATPPNMNVDTTPAIDSLLIPGTNESPVNTSSTFKEKTQASPTNTHSSTERKPKEPTAYTSSEATKESIVAALAFLENHAASSSLPYEKNKNQLTNTTSSSSGNSNGSSIVIPPLIREKPRKPNKKVTKKPVEITPPANNTPTTPRYNSRYVHNSTKASIITPPRNDRTKSNNTQSAQNDTKKAHTITPPVNGNNQPLRGTIEADIGPSRYYKNKSVVFNSPTTSRNKCKNNSVTIIADGISSNTPKTNSIPGTPGSGIIIFSASETSNTKDRTEGSEDINDRAPLSQEAINPPSYNNPCPTSVPREALGSNNPETIHSIPPPLNSMQFTPTNYPAPEFIPSTLEANNPNAGGRYACYSFPTVYPQNNMFTAGHELSNEAFNAIPHQINELPVFTGTNFASYPTFGNNYNMTFIQPNPIGLQEVSVSQPKNTEPYVNTHTEDISESCKIAQSKISRDTTDHILSIEASQPASENNMSELSMPLTIKKEEPDIVEIYSSDNESVSSKYPEIDISNINEIDEVDELSSIHPNEDSYQPQSVAIKQSENIEQDLDSLSSGQSVIIKQSEPASDSQPDNLETHGQGEPEQHIVSMVEEERRSLIKNLCFEIDPLYQKILKIHQLEGLKFLWNHVYEKRQGCLLCHAMGLGKTLQIIALLSTMYRHLEFSPDSNPRISKRVLILAPLITLVNWSNEFTKWATDDFEANVGCVYNISEVAGFSDPSVRTRFLKHWYIHGGVMLINYDLFRIMLSNNDTTDPLYTYLLNPGPDIVILDEGHRIKNSESLVSILIHKIKTKLRICLTGYPLQNHLSEFHCMVDFVAPLLLGTEEHFKNKYRHDIERCYADSTESEKMRAAASLYTVQLLASMVTHRRDESILADELPKKTEFNVQFKMTSAQRQLYNWVIRNFQPNDSALTSLLILRSICNHPKIFQEFILRRMASSNVTKQTKKYVKRGVRDEPIDDIIEENEDDVFFNWFAKSASDMRQLHSDLNFEDWECSGKVLFTIDVCRECKAIKEKIVIVSHSIACLDYLQKQLPKADIKICRVDGQTAAGIRQEIIDRFQYNNEVTALLLSAKAAAIGVNIVSANRIILFDQDWNPLYDEQSVGRIYRYGQTKPVYVYRLLIGDSIEERISAQSFHKKSISRRLIDNEAVTTISKSNLRAYFKLAGQDLPSISVERILNRDINNDVLTLNVLKKNEFRITSFNNHELLKGDMNYSIYMTDYVKARAKKEAMEVLKLWKISNSQNRLE